ncbi:MAG: TdeIII family type II restriction endonuclease, partial [Candidatus Hydrothermota bacterium]
MSLSKKQIAEIEATIIKSIRKKLRSYKPETKSMPFHYRLLGKDRMALFSFIHSLNTTFGTSIFEPVAITLAKFNFPKAERGYKLGGFISEEAQKVIQTIINELTVRVRNPDKLQEIELIRKVATKGKMNRIKIVRVDVYLEDANGEIHLFDIKTAKPNISNFRDFKRTLLEWVAIVLAENPNAKVHSYIAIPYNPYEP